MPYSPTMGNPDMRLSTVGVFRNTPVTANIRLSRNIISYDADGRERARKCYSWSGCGPAPSIATYPYRQSGE